MDPSSFLFLHLSIIHPSILLSCFDVRSPFYAQFFIILFSIFI